MPGNKSMQLSREEIDNIPHKWLEVIIHFLMGFRNDTVDFSTPHLRPSVSRVYPLFVFLYAVIVLFGTLSNIAVVWTISKHRLHRDPTYSYIVNLAVADVVKCVLVLPISLAILLVQNWIFGSFMCFFLPMLQDIPLHVTMLTFLLIAVDRYRLILDPRKPRLPSFICVVGTWLLAICIVLPYPIYTTYLDLGNFVQEQFKGVGICAVNLVDDMQEYMRGLFIVMYVLPLSVISYLYVRVSRELKAADGPLSIMMFDSRPRSRSDFHDLSDGVEGHLAIGSPQPAFDLYEAELDVNKEKRTQKYMISMVTMFAICLCPLMVLRLAKLALTETYENSGHFDITFTMFVWIAFIPTCTTPVLFASWRMTRVEKERLRCQLHLSTRPAATPCSVSGGPGALAPRGVAFVRGGGGGGGGGGAPSDLCTHDAFYHHEITSS